MNLRSLSRAPLCVLLLLCCVLVSACSLRGTDGEDVVTEIAPADREGPRDLSGTTLEDEEISLAQFRGDVVVLNIWWSGCAPCRRELPMLQELHEQYAGKGVEFLGIDLREASKANGLRFQQEQGVRYPSIYDQGGRTLLELRGIVPPTSMPSTLVLDTEGRVAARILGEIPSKTTLRTLIDTVLAEEAGEDG